MAVPNPCISVKLDEDRPRYTRFSRRRNMEVNLLSSSGFVKA